MKTLLFLFALALVSTAAWGDFSCPNGTNEACLTDGDTVCPASAKCVDDDAVCLDKRSCDSPRGFICGSEYDDVLNDHKKVVSQYNQLLSENVDLREKRLQQNNCIMNASTLKDAKKCIA